MGHQYFLSIEKSLTQYLLKRLSIAFHYYKHFIELSKFYLKNLEKMDRPKHSIDLYNTYTY